ncbi:MAG: helix-turn-helix transcriptional regulator [Anaerotignum sp.]|nr:helix-turn-helix transcriptional regulator [Anaerotignum sp.]
MEFCEKLQELRKSRGLTQEELAEALHVSRTAVSKWESGRGYPSIDSLKEISNYFSVTVDELLSGEKLIFIAEKENKSNIRNICDLLFGAADLLSFLLIVLPLYPKTVDGYIYSVNLWMYTETAAYNRMVYWILFLALMASGVVKILQTQRKIEKGWKTVTMCSVFLSIGTVLYLVLARETYAAAVAFLLMIMKGLLVFRHIKSD